jgi:hypothetical protein
MRAHQLEQLVPGARDRQRRGNDRGPPLGRMPCRRCRRSVSGSGRRSAPSSQSRATRKGTGPVFRAVGRGERVSREALADDSAARIVKRYARRVGLDPASYAGHSLRSGFSHRRPKRGRASGSSVRSAGTGRSTRCAATCGVLTCSRSMPVLRSCEPPDHHPNRQISVRHAGSRCVGHHPPSRVRTRAKAIQRLALRRRRKATSRAKAWASRQAGEHAERHVRVPYPRRQGVRLVAGARLLQGDTMTGRLAIRIAGRATACGI